MARRTGLGRGIGALIPTDLSVDGVGDAALIEVPISSIEPNPYQPRTFFDEEMLVSLAASIREVGVLQPLLVRPLDGDRYQLIAGERRWRAAKRAGMATVPAIVRDSNDLQAVEQALVENLHRSDLTPLEEAAAYQQLIEDFGLTHDQVATRVGKSRTAVSNTLRLLGLPPSIQHLLAEGRLAAGHARALLGTPDRAFQESLARRAAQEGWSVRSVEEAVRARQATGSVSDVADALAASLDEADHGGEAMGASRRASTLRPPGLLELEELLASYLDTRVEIAMGAKRGRVVVEFATVEDLERIYHRITGH